ncbi:hypothetical protein PVL29_027217 [Vitis rotundifolia]|uniref:Magnesium transporter n=2 Tax=Vitis rotundifolia TaxID=103349 RepID=A0AA38YIM1_VITRO|nr:hypothetical protein PVL29_027217 [Vitis rotundifolia]
MVSKPNTEEEMAKFAIVPAQTRRKGIGIRAWLVVLESGQSHLEELGKHSVMRRTGLPARDLRVLDPVLSYPSTILGRERAIVINLEHIKAIITAKEVLMVNSNNPLVVQFVEDLQHRIMPKPAMESHDEEIEDAADANWGSPSVHGFNGSVTNSRKRPSQRVNVSSEVLNVDVKEDSPKTSEDERVAAGPKVLPFEFRALEACLESACRCLESETQTLEQEAYPALDELTSNISTLNLERVRQIKSRLVAISGRVQKVRDELEHLLDDDNDMAEMFLTEKLVRPSLDQSSIKEELCNDELEEDDERTEESKSESNSEIFSGFKPNIEELEMLLEAYFVQVDGILQKLSDMSEYVGDTEDFINIMLDDKQNQLLQMGVMLSTANMIINAGIVVVGLFGMNITISLFDGGPSTKFLETSLGTLGSCVALYLIAFVWGKKKKLLGS